MLSTMEGIVHVSVKAQIATHTDSNRILPPDYNTEMVSCAHALGLTQYR